MRDTKAVQPFTLTLKSGDWFRPPSRCYPDGMAIAPDPRWLPVEKRDSDYLDRLGTLRVWKNNSMIAELSIGLLMDAYVAIFRLVDASQLQIEDVFPKDAAKPFWTCFRPDEEFGDNDALRLIVSGENPPCTVVVWGSRPSIIGSQV